MPHFTDIVELTEQRYLNRVPAAIRRSRTLRANDILTFLELMDQASYTGGSHPEVAKISTTALAKAVGVSRQEMTKIENRLRWYGLALRPESRSGIIHLPPGLRLTLGQMVALWPRGLRNDELWQRLLDVMAGNPLTEPFLEKFQDLKSAPWALSTPTGVYIDAHRRLCESLKTVVMPLGSMPLHQIEEGGQYRNTCDASPPGPPRDLPAEDSPVKKSAKDLLKGIAEDATEKVGQKREKLAARTKGRPGRQRLTKPTKTPSELHIEKLAEGSATHWIRFLYIAADDHDVPLWFRKNTTDENALSETEVREGKTFRGQAVHRYVMTFVSTATEAIFNSDTPDNRMRLAAFIQTGLFPNWQYYRSVILKKKAEDDFTFHPKYLTKAVDSLVTLAKSWQAERTRTTAPVGADTYFDRLKSKE